MRRKAQDLTVQAQSRARGEIDRRRTRAATTLEGLADALRPDRVARRKTLAVAGGSGLALTAALGIGVALGFVMSRELKKRADQRAQSEEIKEAEGDRAPPPKATPLDATAAALNL
jgi:pantoate kinase